MYWIWITDYAFKTGSLKSGQFPTGEKLSNKMCVGLLFGQNVGLVVCSRDSTMFQNWETFWQWVMSMNTQHSKLLKNTKANQVQYTTYIGSLRHPWTDIYFSFSIINWTLKYIKHILHNIERCIINYESSELSRPLEVSYSVKLPVPVLKDMTVCCSTSPQKCPQVLNRVGMGQQLNYLVNEALSLTNAVTALEESWRYCHVPFVKPWRQHLS